MGLFRKSTSSSSSNRAPPTGGGGYAPPSGPPPGFVPSSSNPYARPPNQPSTPMYAPPPNPPQQYQQQQRYQQPPGPPPNWQGSAGGPPPPQQQVQQRQGGGEDPLAALAKFDTAFLIDDSESMELFWDELGLALQGIVAKSVQYDSDGVDISFFNNRTTATSKSADEIFSLFRRVEPRKSTPTASALSRVLEPYMSNLENWLIEGKPTGYPRPKPLNLIILTDGAPDKNEDPEPIIVDIARRLDKGRFPPFQIGLQFVQIGVDEEAAEHLRKLDDDLKSKHGIRDYVDTVLFDSKKGVLGEEYLLKALLGAMNRSIDKQQ